MQSSTSNENRLLAALGYPIWIVAVVVLLTDMKNNRFMKVHAVQALGLFVAFIIIRVAIGIIAGLGSLYGLYTLESLAWLVYVILALVYAYRAYQGQTFSIPVISQFTDRYVGEAK
ncbi:MAG TPA: DUF4870 domain-containing protein [bacterium]